MHRRPRGTKSRAAIIGAAVRELRNLRGWTLKTLSSKVGISVSGLSQIENGRTLHVRSRNVSRLAKALTTAEPCLDPKVCAAKVAAEATTLTQRRAVDDLLSLPPDLVEVAAEFVAELRSTIKKGSNE